MKKLVSLILKAIVMYFAITGTILCIFAGGDSFMGGARVLMFFTIQSNIALAIISLIGFIKLIGKKPIGNSWYIVRLLGAVSITLTGVVFCFVLAPTMGAAAWNRVNVYTHVIVPIAAIADFFLSCQDSNIKKIHVLYTPVPAIIYAIYAGIGYVLKWEFADGIYYPYFFLNWGSPAGAFGFCKGLPLMGCMWWILLLLIFILLVGILYLSILNKIKNKQTSI